MDDGRRQRLSFGGGQKVEGEKRDGSGKESDNEKYELYMI
jgi:hypothetical protein